MYAGVRGMGETSWTDILKAGVSTGLQVVGNVFGGKKTYPVNTSPIDIGSSNSRGIDMTTLALIGFGAFLLVKAMK